MTDVNFPIISTPRFTVMAGLVPAIHVFIFNF
jgi:hypothetical protein